MADLIKEIKRNRKFILFEILVWLIVSVAALFYLKDIKLIAALIKTVPEYRNAAQVVWQSAFYISQTVYRVLIPVVFGCMILRYAIYDNKKQQLIKASFPVSLAKESLFELLNGIVPFILMFFIRNTLSIVGSYTIMVDVIEQNRRFHVMDLYYQIEELQMAMIFYTLLVISKRVASNVWGMLLFFVLSSLVSFGVLVAVMDFCFAHNINIPASVIIAVPVIIFVILSILLFVITKKVDISKGGTYYFKSVHIFVIISSGVFSFLLMEEFIKMSFDKVNPILLVTILIVSAAIAFGIWYLTASHYKTRKIK